MGEGTEPLGEAEALAIARRAHEGQRDKGGAPYLAHPLRVMACFSDPVLRVVAVLHDAVEDGAGNGVTLQTVVDAGASQEVLAALDAMTHRPGEANEDYWVRVAANRIAREVKLADLADNSDPTRLAQVPEPKRSQLAAKYDRARAFFLAPPQDGGGGATPPRG